MSLLDEEQCKWYKHKLETCCICGGLGGRISQSSDESGWCWRCIPLWTRGGDGDRCIESCIENSTSWSSFKQSHSPSTDTRKLHRYMVSCAPAISCSIMIEPFRCSPGGKLFKLPWASWRIEIHSNLSENQFFPLLSFSILLFFAIVYRSWLEQWHSFQSFHLFSSSHNSVYFADKTNDKS